MTASQTSSNEKHNRNSETNPGGFLFHLGIRPTLPMLQGNDRKLNGLIIDSAIAATVRGSQAESQNTASRREVTGKAIAPGETVRLT